MFNAEDRAVQQFRIDSTFGVVVEGSAEYMTTDRRGLYTDFKRIRLSPDATGVAKFPIGSVPVTAEATINLVVAVGDIVFRF